MARRLQAAVLGSVLLSAAATAGAQERPFFVTYGSHLEEVRELEVSVLSTIGEPKDGAPRYVAPWIELEYGITRRWTAELYFEGVNVHDDASAYTGWRIENRFRPFAGDHFVNPILYIEYESINEASRIQKEIVGEGPIPDEPLGALKREHAHELEGRLILSKNGANWELAGNLILEKNLSADEGVEFGYSTGAWRRFRRLMAGFELYGGLGATVASDEETRHFIAPLVGWRVTKRSMVKASVGFGLTEASDRYLVRVGYSMDLW
jgi:Putative MetA-pathway of phenol degradation